jgi:hypothetical protein
LRPIRGEKAIGEIASMGASNAMSTYIKIVIILIYFIERDRIKVIEGEIQPSN